MLLTMQRAAPAYVSQRLKLAVLARRASGQRQHQLARQAGLHPSVFSSLVNDIIPIRTDDPRVLKIAEVVGVPAEEAFEPVRR
jgi:hypothetical protein